MMENMNKSDLNQWVGSRIQTERMRHGMTQETLAEAIGVSRNYISMLETGRKAARLETYCRIAGVFGIFLYELFLVKESFDEQEQLLAMLCNCSPTEKHALFEIIRAVRAQIALLVR